jgi:threonine dehydrogenase-like Zn-dependent dehydrogenase
MTSSDTRGSQLASVTIAETATVSDAANVKPGAIVAVVGDGAVGLLGVLSASRWVPNA